MYLAVDCRSGPPAWNFKYQVKLFCIVFFQQYTETDQNKTAVFNDSSTSEKNSEAIGSLTEDGRLKGFFCSKTVFNLSKKILTEAEIKVLEKGLDFAPIQKTLNERELRKDFEEFSRKMRCK